MVASALVAGLAPLRLSVVIPARDEVGAIAAVIGRIPRVPETEVIVVDNGSRDGTAAAARGAGARVIEEPRRGYGRACLAGVRASDRPDIVAFIDGDGSMPPETIGDLVAPIVAGDADLVCATRVAERGSMPAHQALGNRLCLLLLRMLYGVRLTDLGPYRAVRADLLMSLGMRASRYAWSAEMLARTARRGGRIIEVPAPYHRRLAGRSKVGGTLRGSLGAGAGLIGALLWHRVRP